MTVRKLILATVLAILTVPSLALADHEHRVTVLMRNGDRVAGLLEDVEGGVVFVRASLHDQRRLPLSDVALIDLVGGATGLPETELSVARGPNELALLRDGSSLQGKFVDIHGGEATAAANETHTLIFRTTSGEERRIPLDNVSRIYMGHFPGTAPAAAQAPPAAAPSFTTGEPLPAGAVRVPANAPWTQTPLMVRRGESVRFDARGRVQLSDDTSDVAEPAGSVRERRANGAPLPQNFAGALIAKVGNSAAFPIGNQTTVVMPADGVLFLGVNDDEFNDNRGEFVVSVAPMRRRGR
jgi:PA-IL-like protein